MANIKKLLEDRETVENEEELDINLTDQVALEMEAALQELAPHHADSEEYGKMAANLKTMSEVYEKCAKAEKERRVDTEPVHDRGIDWNVVGPKIAGAVVYGAVMVTFIAIEREHPPAMRLVNAMNALLTPRL